MSQKTWVQALKRLSRRRGTGRCARRIPRLVCLAQEEMTLADEALGQAKAVGESSVRRAVGCFRVAASRVQSQTRLVDLVHVKKYLKTPA